MALVEVDVVGLQTLERGVDLLVDLRSREPGVGVAHREEDLGGEHVGGALAPGERLAQQRLGRAPSIDVGGVDEVDAGLEGGIDAGLGLSGLDATRVGEPRAEADLGDLEVA